MEIKDGIYIVMLLIVTAYFSYPNHSKYIEDLEYGYFEGQIDALNGDFRVRKDSITGCYTWVKSPWEDTFRTPIYKLKCE